ANDKEAANAALSNAISTIESACSKGVYHKNNAARKVSRITKLVNTLA
ncbi:MAG: 30S ribosomal protein S20, partial [Lachnospiraceae bacterium]|nr:30S ribosomal protein S20 [Lachnospiraceae bacterium]